MAEEAQLTLRPVELLLYSADLEASLDFYSNQLGWNIIWESEGNMATIDAGGAYQLTVVAAKWAQGWQEGLPTPEPQLALQSQDLHRDAALLADRGLPGIAVNGDPAEMLFASIPGPDGREIFAWQDNEEGGATKVVEDYKAQGGHQQLYASGECNYFSDDLQQAKQLFVGKLGFEVKIEHGTLFTGMQVGDSPVVGLFDLQLLRDQPVFSPGNTNPRLFLECTDLAAELERQIALGAKPGEVFAEPDGLSWFSTTDPDGNPATFWQFSPPASE